MASFPASCNSASLLAVSSFLDPPDVYALCLTCTRFHAPRHVTDGRVLATDLLRESLLLSLAKVLEHQKQREHSENQQELDRINSSRAGDYFRMEPDLRGCAMSLESLTAALQAGPVGGAVLSGSAMVQAALGETWNSDLDIFCTQGAAPAVRSALLRAGYFLEHRDRRNGGSEIRDHHEYGGEASEPFRTIDHVEKYCRQTNADHPRMEEYPEFARLEPPSVAAEAVEWVTRVNAVDLAGNLLPAHCRWPYCACLDLVVGYNCAMATDVLKFFDITICAASFDGTTFRIPSPHLTFTRRTHIEPARVEPEPS